MTRLTPLLERNKQFARSYTPIPLRPPTAGVVILTCLDHWVDPAIVVGLRLGDAPVIRNAGGRVTQAVIDDLAYLAFLAQQMFGGQGARTRCSKWPSSITPSAARDGWPTLSSVTRPPRRPALPSPYSKPPRSATPMPASRPMSNGCSPHPRCRRGSVSPATSTTSALDASPPPSTLAFRHRARSWRLSPYGRACRYSGLSWHWLQPRDTGPGRARPLTQIRRDYQPLIARSW